MLLRLSDPDSQHPCQGPWPLPRRGFHRPRRGLRPLWASPKFTRGGHSPPHPPPSQARDWGTSSPRPPMRGGISPLSTPPLTFGRPLRGLPHSASSGDQAPHLPSGGGPGPRLTLARQALDLRGPTGLSGSVQSLPRSIGSGRD